MPTSKMQEEGERVRGLQAVYACGRRRETRKHLGATLASIKQKRHHPHNRVPWLLAGGCFEGKKIMRVRSRVEIKNDEVDDG